MDFPAIDPIALEIGPLAIRWYALAYVAGILLGQWYVGWLDRRHAPSPQPSPARGEGENRPILTAKIRDDLVLYAVLGIILGGRLGYVLFYNTAYYLDHPADILKLWQGGMAFHGGLVGVIAAFYLLARKHGIRWLALMDLIAAAAPIGLFFGRLANFVNGELYGRVTTAPWGMVFPQGGPLPRHPSQLYEAGLEGLALGVLLFVLATRTRALTRPGLLSGLFLIGYGLARFAVECVREPDAQLGTLALGLSMGQMLCVPMLAVGSWLVAQRRG